MGLEVEIGCMFQSSKSERIAICINKQNCVCDEKKNTLITLKSNHLKWKVSNTRCAFKNMKGLKTK